MTIIYKNPSSKGGNTWSYAFLYAFLKLWPKTLLLLVFGSLYNSMKHRNADTHLDYPKPS